MRCARCEFRLMSTNKQILLSTVKLLEEVKRFGCELQRFYLISREPLILYSSNLITVNVPPMKQPTVITLLLPI